MGLFSGKIDRHQMAVLRMCPEMLREEERVYRNHVQLFSEEFSPASITGEGLARARLFTACFPAFAFSRRWGAKHPDRGHETLQAASGLAMTPLLEPGASPALSLERAKEFGKEFMYEQMRTIGRELSQGPSRALPFGGDGWTDAFRSLLDTSHNNLIVSVGVDLYSDEARARFEPMFAGALFSRMRVVEELAEAMR